MGIMGGTFDPVHYGHLVAAEAARHRFGLVTVVFVPAGCPPHKRGLVRTNPRERYRLTELATCSNPWFRVSPLEIDRPGCSYTIDTARAFRALYGPDARLYFITGADALLEIMTWYRVEELLNECQFIAVTRPGYGGDQLRAIIDEWPAAFVSRFHFLAIPGLAISSTEIRRRLGTGRPIKYLVPETVENYIREVGLYQTNA
ncbi:MAG: nicotinate-nucleotide adenylyltransferase [Heliobacteriaceae bacterium]|nr:nicotinate-nucleotide adenylyltransferase [Heliobacteriaceae bacterium]